MRAHKTKNHLYDHVPVQVVSVCLVNALFDLFCRLKAVRMRRPPPRRGTAAVIRNRSVAPPCGCTACGQCQSVLGLQATAQQSSPGPAWLPLGLCSGRQQCRLLLGPRGFHGHAGPHHSRIAPVPPHSIGPKRGAGPAQPAQGPQDGAGTHRSAPWSPTHTQPLHLVQQVEVVDGHADVRLALAVPAPLPAPHPARHLLQDGAGRFGGQEVVVGGALEVEARRRRHRRGPLACGRVWRGGRTQGVWDGRPVGGDGGAE